MWSPGGAAQSLAIPSLTMVRYSACNLWYSLYNLTPKRSQLHTHAFIHSLYAFLVIPGDTLVMSGDQVGMNGDEGGGGWGLRRFGERYTEKKGLSGKTVQNDINLPHPSPNLPRINADKRGSR